MMYCVFQTQFIYITLVKKNHFFYVEILSRQNRSSPSENIDVQSLLGIYMTGSVTSRKKYKYFHNLCFAIKVSVSFLLYQNKLRTVLIFIGLAKTKDGHLVTLDHRKGIMVFDAETGACIKNHFFPPINSPTGQAKFRFIAVHEDTVIAVNLGRNRFYNGFNTYMVVDKEFFL